MSTPDRVPSTQAFFQPEELPPDENTVSRPAVESHSLITLSHPCSPEPDSNLTNLQVTTPHYSTNHPSSAVPSIPGYTIEQELARGGMGVVYRARHLRLNRVTALKMILGGKVQDETTRVRFLIEAEAVAQIQHPHVVQVFDYGEYDGLPFMAMEYLEGGSLSDRVKRVGLFPQREAARVVTVLASAVAAAHARGIIHRDLKPSNVLLTTAGEPKITDFGLARIGDSGMTVTGAIIGTPSFMAPEQAAGRVHDIDTRTDVYALGAILYWLLTGRPPLKGETTQATLLLVINEEPLPPSRQNPATPRDLETICLKCLAKDPARRYPTAEALAEDIQAFLDGRPIQARPVSTFERTWKWMQRRPAIASLLALLIMVLGLSIAMGIRFTLQLNASRWEADSAARREKHERERAEQNEREARSAESLAARRREQAETALFQNRLTLAEAQWKSGNPTNALLELERCRWDRRGWEWRHLRDKFAARGEPLALLRNIPSARSLALSPDGQQLVIGGEHQLFIWKVGTGAITEVPNSRHGGRVDLAFVPDGTAYLIGDQTGRMKGYVELCRAGTTDRIRLFTEELPVGQGVAISSDGMWVAASGGLHGQKNAGRICVWNKETGELHLDLKELPALVTRVQFSPDGRFLAGATAGTVLVWDARDGKLMTTLATRSWGTALVFSPDGMLLAAAGAMLDRAGEVVRSAPGGTHVWETRTWREVVHLQSQAEVNALAFSPDGKHLAIASGDVGGYQSNELRFFDTKQFRESASYLGAASAVRALVFAPDSSRLYTVGIDGVLRTFDATDGKAGLTIEAEVGTSHAERLDINADATVLTYVGLSGRFFRWDARTGMPLKELMFPQAGLPPVHDLSPNQQSFVVAGPNGAAVFDAARGNKKVDLKDSKGTGFCRFVGEATVLGLQRGKGFLLWDVATGELRHRIPTPLPDLSFYGALAVSADGSRFALRFRDEHASMSGTAVEASVIVYDTRKGVELHHWKMLPDRLDLATALNNDGTTLALAWEIPRKTDRGSPEFQTMVSFYDVDTGKEIHRLIVPNRKIEGMSFAPDDRHVALSGMRYATGGSVNGRGEVAIWDRVFGGEVFSLGEMNAVVRVLRWSADGDSLFAMDHHGAIQSWHAGAPWQASLERRVYPEAKGVAFSADGRRVLVGIQPFQFNQRVFGSDPNTRCKAWDIHTGEPIEPCDDPVPAEAKEALSADRSLIVESDGYDVRIWRSGDRTVDAMFAAAVQADWRRLAWHYRESQAAVKEANPFVAIFHLTWLLADPRTSRPELREQRAIMRFVAGELAQGLEDWAAR